MIMNTYINYGGRFSRLCYLIPLMVHTLFLAMVYLIYFNISIINIYILIFIVILINIEWPIVIVYEYIYLTNYNIQNNLLHNIMILILLEIILFAGFYWLYINSIIHTSYTFSTSISTEIYMNNNITNISDSNMDLCIVSIIYNLLILLYVTLILQLVHRYVTV